MTADFQEEKWSPAADVQRPRIVVADDNVPYLNEICDLLEDRYEVVARATNGCECVEAVQRLLPSVVVTDVSMPKMNGIEATRQITKDWPDVRVVVLSADDHPAFVQAALDAGALAYVAKLAAFKDLVPAIEEVLAGRSCVPVLR